MLLSDKPPDRRRLHQASFFFRIGVYAIVVGGVAAATLSSLNLNTSIIASSWLLLLIFYLYLRRELKRRNHWLMREEGVFYHGLAGVLGVGLTYTAFELFGYGVGGLDPLNFCLLMLAPLGLVSRYGSTKNWVWLLLIAISLQLGIRITLANFVEIPSSGIQGLRFTEPNPSYFFFIYNLPIFAQTCLIALLSYGVHSEFRWRRNLLIQAEIELQVANRLASGVTIERDFTAAAEAIHKLDRSSTDYYPFVFIMRWDDGSERLRVVGGAGKKNADWENIELRKGEGITGRAFAQGITLNIADVSKLSSDEYVCPKGFEHIRSELATPISYQDNTLGVLTVQSTKRNFFDDYDERLLGALAGSLGIAFANALNLDRRVTNAYKLAQEVLKAGEDYQYISKWFDSVFEAGKLYLNCDGFVLLRLASGTGYPLRPPIIRPKNTRTLPQYAWPVPDHSYFWRLLEQWEPKFMTHAIKSDDMNSYADDLFTLGFLQGTGAKAIAFIPIGLYERIAIMFIQYNSDRTFGDADKLALATFSAALESSYRQLSPSQMKTHRWGAFIHEGLNPQIHNLNAQLDMIKKNKNNPEEIPSLVESAQQLVQRTREQITLATAGLGFHYDPNIHTLKEGLNKAAGRLALGREKRPTAVIRGTECVEDEDRNFVDLLYRLAIEGMANAIEHGDATLIRVEFQRTDRSISIEIVDNGRGLAMGHKKNRPYGIYSLRKMLRREFDIELCIENLEDTGGVRVSTSFPLIPVFSVM